MELKCPSLKYVNAMTWAEFQIRLYGWEREQKRNDERFREVAWSSYVGGSLMLKKIPSKEQFWRIHETGQAKTTESQIKAIKEARERHKNSKLNNGK